MTSTSSTPSTALSTRANVALAQSARLKPFGMLEDYSASCPWSVFPRKKLDVTYSDIVAGLRGCLSLSESQRDEYLTSIARHWDPSGDAMVTLSVRTGFDLLLQTLKLPAGSEILCSAITIPDMIYIIKYHNLVPVPVDIHADTLSVDVEKLRHAITDKTRVILIAHIFGSRHPMDAVVALAEEHNLLVVEDCAQAFVGMQFTGERGADVSMFSFGTIKTTTAFGGAVIRVKNEAIRDEMKRRESRYPARSTAFFLKRLLKYGAVHSLSTPAIFGIAIHTCRGLGGDFDKVITAAIRGFSGGELVSLIRFRPSMPLLGLLHHRLTAVDDAYIELRRLKSERLTLALKDVPQLEIPGLDARSHYYWLFPVLVAEPERVKQYMNQHGFDVTSGATQLAYVPSPKGEAHDPAYAKRIMSSIVYLPITAETPEWAIDKMVKHLKEALQTSRL